MKPFDIELAKQGHPICTRGGRPARIICWDRIDSSFPIIALTTTKDGSEVAWSYTIDGKYNVGNKEDSLDLMMATTKPKGWINLFKSKDGVHHAGTYIFKTKDEAINHSDDEDDYVTTIPISWEE